MVRKIQKMWYIPLAGLFLAAIIRAFTVEPVPQILSSEKRIVSFEQWELKKTENNEWQEYECQIPEELGTEVVLSIRGILSSVSVFLDGQEIYTCRDAFMENGISWKWIDLPENMAGHTLTLRYPFEQGRYESVAKGNVWLGDKNTVFLEILKMNRFALLFGTLTILAGLLICLGAMILHRRLVTDAWKGVHYLGIFILLAGVWAITDSSILQFVTGNVSVVVLVSFLSFMLMPYFLLRFVRKMMIYRTKGIMMLAYLHLVNAAVCTLLYLFALVPLQKSLISVHILIVVSAGVVAKSALQEVRKYKNREMKIILAGLGALLVFLAVALGMFYSDVVSSSYALFYDIGITIFELSLMGAAVERLRYYMDASANAEKYRTIAHEDVMTHMGNRVAFTKQQELGSWKENRSYIVLDINNLKATNDTYGHQTGDQLIIDAGGCVLSAFREEGKCYRIGGDEFVVILPIDSKQEIETKLERLEHVIAQKNQERDVPVELAYGYSVRKSQEDSNQELFNIADANMYTKKQQMKNKRSLLPI